MMRYSRVRSAGLLLGLGLGGFAEVILLRQVEPWIHAAAWAAAFGGVIALWRAIRGPGRLPRTRTLLGYLLVGWGVFNLAEGLVAHHVLGLHYLHWLYVIAGAALVLVGLAVRDGDDRMPAPAAERRMGRDRRLAL